MFFGAIGQFALGQFLQATHVNLELGSYNVTGLDATLTKQGAVTIDPDLGTYTITGQDVTLTRTYILSADLGAYTLTGQTAATAKGYLLTPDAGSYVKTGLAATLEKTGSFVLLPELGVYNLTGLNPTLTGQVRRSKWRAISSGASTSRAAVAARQTSSATIEFG